MLALFNLQLQVTHTLHSYFPSVNAVSPKVCDPSDASQYQDLIREVDVVIDAVGGDKIANIGHLILDTAIEQAKKARPQGPPLSYIYCSGRSSHHHNYIGRTLAEHGMSSERLM